MICQIITLVLRSCLPAMATRTAARTIEERFPEGEIV